MAHRFEKSFGPIPEEKRFTVESLPVLIERAEKAIETLESWGIRVPDLGRLRTAKTVLEQTANCGEYAGSDQDLAKIAESIFIAQDFHQVTTAIEDSGVQRLAQDLQQAMGGTVSAHEPQRRPYQYQSQLWFGAAMARGGLQPRVPGPGKKHPDFLVQPNALQYAVEVKRPRRPGKAAGYISSARDQFEAAGKKGIVVVDLTDSLEDVGVRRVLETASDSGQEPIRSAFRTMADTLSARVWDSSAGQHKPGYSSVIGVCVALRGWRWVRHALEAPELFFFIGLQSFSSTKGNVWGHKAAEFFDLLTDGLKKGGVHIHHAEYESDDPNRIPYFDKWPDHPLEGSSAYQTASGSGRCGGLRQNRPTLHLPFPGVTGKVLVSCQRWPVDRPVRRPGNVNCKRPWPSGLRWECVGLK